jgi:L-arabinose isomerase
MIRRLISLTITLAVILAVVGYFRGWYVVTRGDSSGDHLNFGISVDKERIKEDAQRVEDATRKATTEAKEKFDSAAQAIKESRR